MKKSKDKFPLSQNINWWRLPEEVDALSKTIEDIETGQQGLQGIPGPTPWNLPATAYNNGTSYDLKDAVTYEGGYYYRTGNPLNPGYPPTPGSINNSWTPVADKGATGPQGPIGPQGVQGNPGTAGAVGPAGLEWQGSWVSGTTYAADDAVGYDGASWFCILATSGTTTPNLDTTHWALLASQGAQGPTGSQGPTGPQGTAGNLVPIVASAPLTGGTITTSGTIGIAQATNLVDGYITKEAFGTFTGKANVNSQVFTGTPSLPIGTIGVTQAVGTNNTTLATTEFVAKEANNRLVVETASTYPLTNIDSGGIIIFTASATLIIPTGLADGFECTFVTLDGVTLTVPAVAQITLNNATNPTGSNVLAPKSSFTLKRMIAANTFIATGNL